MELSSEWSCCESCGFYYGDRQSESHVEEASTGTPHKPPQKELDGVTMLQDMLERLLHGSLESNRRRAKVMIVAMLDDLREEGVRKYLPKLRPHQEEH